VVSLLTFFKNLNLRGAEAWKSEVWILELELLDSGLQLSDAGELSLMEGDMEVLGADAGDG